MISYLFKFTASSGQIHYQLIAIKCITFFHQCVDNRESASEMREISRQSMNIYDVEVSSTMSKYSQYRKL